jgi:hypothetical protein
MLLKCITKVAPVLKQYTVKTYMRVEVKLHVFLTSALDGGEWYASRSSIAPGGNRPPVPTREEAGWDPELV